MQLRRISDTFSIVSHDSRFYLFWGERLVAVVVNSQCYVKVNFSIPTVHILELTQRAGIDYAFQVVSVDEFYQILG